MLTAGRSRAPGGPAGRRARRAIHSWLADPDLSQCSGPAGFDPRDCPWRFEWSLGGSLLSRTDSMKRTLRWGYDTLGRVGWATGGCESSPGVPCVDPSQGTSFFLYDGQSPEPGHGPWELGALTPDLLT